MPKHTLYSPRTKSYKDIRARIYIQDPLVSTRRSGTLTTLRIPGEPYLGAGPVSGRVAVIDVDETAGITHPPVRPLATRDGFAVGRGDPTTNVKHHQVNVWAIVTRTLGILEDASVFGRSIPWAFPGGRLRIQPHAREEENAYYDRDFGGLQLCYFNDARGRVVHSCLSHDIITHELGHAVLDGLKPLYYETESPDLAGFHEYFGDAVAMASALTLKEVVQEVVHDRPRRLSAMNLVSDMALEFGSRGTGGTAHAPLRSAANRRHMNDLRDNWEEHDYSEVLSGAFYDLLSRQYRDAVPRNQKFFKTRRLDGRVAVASLIGAANRTSRMMLRALDYCPPVGLTYLDYARAILRADEVAYPVDSRGYREMAFQVLRRRGLLRNRAQGRPELQLKNSACREYDVERLSATRTGAYEFLDQNREALNIPRNVNFGVWSLYRTRKISSERYYPPREIVIEFGWGHDLPLSGRAYGELDGETLILWCGGTLVFDSDGNVLHYVVKLPTPRRIQRCLQYVRHGVREGWLGTRLKVRVAGPRIQLQIEPKFRHQGRGSSRRGR